MKTLVLIMTALSLVLASVCIGPAIAKKAATRKASKPSSLVLLYTSCARGRIRACNCTKFQFGGYGRQMTLVKSIRKENKDVVLIEGGDIAAGEDFQAKLKAGVASKALESMKYDAVVPGELELGKTGIRFINYFNPKSLPVLCANVPDLDKDKGYLPYKIIKTKGNLRVGMIALLDDDITRDLRRHGVQEKVNDPVPILKSIAPKLRGKVDLLIVAYHGPFQTAGRLAAIKGVDIVLCAHLAGRDFLFPSETSNEVTAPVSKKGSVIIVQGQTTTNWSLGRIDLALTPDSKIKSARHKLYYLDRRYEEDPVMVKVYDTYNDNVAKAVLAESKKIKQDMEVMLISRGANLDEMRKKLHKSPFAGDAQCKTCHSDIHESWSKSLHAQAMATLNKTKQGFDPECVSCHVTGAGVRNGFVNKSDTPELVNIQCEACHGPGLAHSNSPKAGYGTTGEETCRSCHNDEKHPDFDYESAWGKIKH